MSVSLRPVKWDETAECHIAMACEHDAAGFSAGWYRDEIEAGRMALLGGFVEGVHVATAAYRIEQNSLGNEFMIAAAGGASGGDHTGVFWEALEAMAAMAGCDYVRFHTQRGGLVKAAQARGYGEWEVIMRKPVSR